MLLWEEIPVYWAIRFEREATYGDAENQLAELIARGVLDIQIAVTKEIGMYHDKLGIMTN